jgi:hypothetical protein
LIVAAPGDSKRKRRRREDSQRRLIARDIDAYSSPACAVPRLSLRLLAMMRVTVACLPIRSGDPQLSLGVSAQLLQSHSSILDDPRFKSVLHVGPTEEQ